MKMRVAASAAVTVLVAGALSGCMFFTPQQTDRSYTPSDGVNGSVGDVSIRNVLLVTDEGESSPRAANMLGVLVNSGDSAKTVTLQYETGSATETTTLTVPAGGLLSLRPDAATPIDTAVPAKAKAVQLEGVDATPGGLFSVGFTVRGSDPISLQLPVLTGTLSEYSSLLPTPTATPAPSLTPVDAATETPAPTDSATPEPSPTD